jgi:hypothetical protein
VILQEIWCDLLWLAGAESGVVIYACTCSSQLDGASRFFRGKNRVQSEEGWPARTGLLKKALNQVGEAQPGEDISTVEEEFFGLLVI